MVLHPDSLGICSFSLFMRCGTLMARSFIRVVCERKLCRRGKENWGYLTVFDWWLSFFDGIQDDQIDLSLSVWMIDLNVECVTIAKKV